MKEIHLSPLQVFKLFELDAYMQAMLGTKCKYFATDGKVGYYSNNKKYLFHVFAIIKEG